jgi:CelD/BcsL family acetyltransferase involved in cellulose biosynthesis
MPLLAPCDFLAVRRASLIHCRRMAFTTAAFEIRILESLESISPSDWKNLLVRSRNATIFQSHGRTDAWWSTFRTSSDQLRLVTATRGGHLVGIAPLYHSSLAGHPCLRFVGQPHADYLFFLERGGSESISSALVDAAFEADQDIEHVMFADVPAYSSLGRILHARSHAPFSRLLETAVTPCPRL